MTILVPPRGTRGAEFPKLARGLMRPMQGLFHLVFRRFGDRMRVQGRPLLELETVGARTGARRRAILAWFPDTSAEPARNPSESIDRWLVVASNAGSARHPAWFLNLARHPDQVTITVDRRRVEVTPETLEGAEREQAWQQIVSLASGYAGYLEKTDRACPIVRLSAQRE